MSYTEDDNPIYIYTNEAVTWSMGSSITLIDYSSGPGVVESVQFSQTGTNYNAILNITIDGGTAMACSYPVFFGFALDPASTTPVPTKSPYAYNPNIYCGFSNENYTNQCGPSWASTKRVFIPFTSSILITISGNTVTNFTVNSQVIYKKWPTPFPLYYSIGERRKYWKVMQDGTWSNYISIEPYGEHITPTITGRGQIEFITHVLYNVSSIYPRDPGCYPWTCLYGEYLMVIDGVTRTYGRSDNFWGGQYGWANGISGIIGANGPDCGTFTLCGRGWQGDFNMHAYRFCYDKPIFFNSSFALGWIYGNNSRSQFGGGVTNSNNIFLISYWLESE